MNIIAQARHRQIPPLTQADLAQQLDTDPAYISQIECGIRKPGPALARKLAKALGLRLGQVRPDWAELSDVL